MSPTPQAAPAEPVSIHALEAQRRANRDAVVQLGLKPYGQRTDGLVPLAHARALFDLAVHEAHEAALAAAKSSPGAVVTDHRPTVAIAGRVMLHRDNGKLIWMTLRDDTGDVQIAASAKDCDEASFKLAKTTDLGDVVIARGRLMRTKTGEITVWCGSIGGAPALEPGAKCLAPPPDKHAGLADMEIRYRQRYVDMWSTPETTKVFKQRSMIVQRVRRFLDERGYLEVETPMLQTLAGGAAARPFRTHMNALGIDLFMRIAPELYLKRLLVGGLPRVYEINRNFRNEGLDKRHNPEFTMLEVYHAFGDARTMMELTESVIRECAAMLASADGRPGNLVLPFGDFAIDYGKPFDRVAYSELFHRGLGFELNDTARVMSEAKSRHVKHEGLAPVLVVNKLFEEVAEPMLDPTRPTFITDYPAAISPLTRPRPENPAIADRADLFIGHMEIAPMYTELNDPDVQEAKFREQLQGLDDEENTFRTFDADFIQALKVGMPPAGGLGLGIDRLVMLLTNQRTIRDVVLFPLLRPEEATGQPH